MNTEVLTFKRILRELGANVSCINETWTLHDLSNSFYEYRDKLEEHFIKNKNEVYLYLTCKYFNSDVKKIEKIVEEIKATYIAYLMVKNCGSNKEWAEKIIEENCDETMAYAMFLNCNSSKEWLEKVKVKSKEKKKELELLYKKI